MDDLFSDRALRDRTLTRADIAPLTGSLQKLVGCNLEEAELSGLDLTGWTFEQCTMRRADVGGAKLEGTMWLSCRGAFANFAASDLTDAQFVAGDFNNASFRRCTLTSAKIARCKLTGADLSEIRGIDIQFDETLLIHAKLPGQSFRKAVLNRIDFSQADLRKCDFRNAVFHDCSLRDAMMDGARFDGADLRGADLGGLRLGDARLFRGATISRDQAGNLLGELGLNVA
ncbi:pentapeptide repeat-containing protein [Sphingobium sp.]|uniref:pentapeptide repeat-containing protein n=1 Tax=Sphingobium sp. TaxID=1912891 RepID=UPI0035C740AD